MAAAIRAGHFFIFFHFKKNARVAQVTALAGNYFLIGKESIRQIRMRH